MERRLKNIKETLDQSVLQNVKVTEEEKNRIITNLDEKKPRKMRPYKYYFSLAAAVFLLIILIPSFTQIINTSDSPDSQYEEFGERSVNDIVAVLNGREIKVEDILWLYSLEENTEERIIGYLKQEVLIQEAKKMGITITEEEIEERKQAMFPNSTASERFEESDNKEFLEKQASILGVSPEDYFEVWEDNSHRAGAYLVNYVFEIFDEPNDAENIEVIEAWDQKVNEHIDDLFQRYKDEGILIIK